MPDHTTATCTTCDWGRAWTHTPMQGDAAILVAEAALAEHNTVTDHAPQRGAPPQRLVEWQGESLSIPEWSRVTGIPRTTLQARLGRLGWSVERALTVPPSPNHPDTRQEAK